MVDFIRENPVTLGRFRAQEQQRAQNQDARLEEQGFQDRYAHETQVGTDRAIRSALAGFNAGPASAPAPAQPTSAPQAQQANTQAPQGPRVGPQLSSSLPGGGGAPAQTPANNRGWAMTPGFNPGGTSTNDRLVQELSRVQGGGALALKTLTMDQDRQNQRMDALEDKAWNMLANAKHPADLEMANAMYKQATNQELPPQWRTHQTALKAATVDAAARERYPRDVVQRRKFIEIGMTQGLEPALRQMAGESVGKGATQMTPQQVYNMAVKAHTVEDPVNFTKSTDWSKVQGAMEAYGYGDQAQAIIGGGDPEAGGQPAGMSEAVAREAAMAEASANAGLFRTDATDFSADGGNRQTFINRRTLELMNGRGGSPVQSETGEVLTPQQVKAKYGNNPPVGLKSQYKGQIVVWDGKQFVLDNPAVDDGAAGTPHTQEASLPPAQAPATQDMAPATPSDREHRRQSAEAELNQAAAEMNALLDQKAARDAWRADAVQKGRRVPQFEEIDRLIEMAIGRAEERISRADVNLSLIVNNGVGGGQNSAGGGDDEAISANRNPLNIPR